MDLQFFYSPGACSLAVHVALEASGLPFEAVATPIAQGAHREAAFLAINAEGCVPALGVDGELLTELPAVLLFVALAAPDAQLLPAEPLAAARVARLLAWIASTLHIGDAQFWRGERFSDDAAVRESLSATALARLPADGWVGGAHFGIGDAALLPFYRWASRLGLDRSAWPRLNALVERALQQPAVQRAMQREGLTTLTPTPDA